MEHGWTLFCLLAIGLSGIHTAPVGQCNIKCKNAPNLKFNYEAGKTYNFKWNTETVTSLTGATSETSTVKLNADVAVTFKSICEVVVQLNHVSLISPSGQVHNAGDLNGVVVRAGWQDGHLEGFCIPDGLSEFAANAARGVLSVLQNTLVTLEDEHAHHDDLDVSGKCQTDYRVESEGSGYKVYKHKNLDGCTKRESNHAFLEATRYTSHSDNQVAPVVASKQDCQQHIAQGLYTKISCNEHYHLVPFSRGKAGGKVDVFATLTATGSQADSASSVKTPVAASLTFDHHGEFHTGNKAATKQILQQLCSQISPRVDVTAASLYQRFVHHVRALQQNDLKSLYQQLSSICPDSERGKTIYFNSLVAALSPGAIAQAADLILAGGYENREKQFYRALPASRHPNKEVLTKIAPLLDRKPSVSSALGVSAVAHRFCRNTGGKCGQYAEYNNLVNKFGKAIGNKCRTPSIEEENKVITALKALGNLDSLTDEVANKIKQCLLEQSLPWRVRFAAFEAYRRNPCRADLKDAAATVLRDVQQDPSERIVAFRALARCPEQKEVDLFQQILDTDEVNQVVAYIAKYIKDVQYSQDPTLIGARKIFKSITFKEHFPFDPRKFSTHLRLERFSEKGNIGASAKGNIIYSPTTYLPRFVSLNSSVHLYGKSYNVFEIGASIEGFEQILESIFGPKGLIRGKDLSEYIEQGKEVLKNFKIDLRGQLRNRRDLSNAEFKELDNQVTLEKNFQKEPMIDLYVRQYGTEYAWYDLRQQEALFERAYMAVAMAIDRAENTKVEMTEPLSLLDQNLHLPSISGLPVVIQLSASSVATLEVESHININQYLKDKNSELKLKLIPSSVTQATFLLGVDAHVFESGLQGVATLNSGSGGALVLKHVPSGKGFELVMEAPFAKTDYIEFKSDLYWLEHTATKDDQKPVTLDHPEQLGKERCSDDIFGLKFCSEWSYTRATEGPFYPLNGPTKISFTTWKADESITAFRAKVQVDLDNPKKHIELVYDAVGGAQPRTFRTTLDVTPGEKAEITADLQTARRNLKAGATISNTDSVSGVEVWAQKNNDKYSAKAALEKSQQGRRWIYTPVIEYTTPSGKESVLSGRLVHQPGKKLEYNVKTGNVIPQAWGFTVKGAINVEKGDDSFKYTLADHVGESRFGKVTLNGFIAKEKGKFEFSLQKDQTYSVNLKLENLSDDKAYHLKTHFDQKGCPILGDIKLDSDIRGEFAGLRQGKIDVKKNLVVNEYSATLEDHITYQIESLKNFEVKRSLKFNLPKSGKSVNHDFFVSGKNKEIKYSSTTELGSGKRFALVADLSYGNVGRFDYKLDGKAEYPGQVIEFHGLRDTQADHRIHHNLKLNLKPGNNYEVDAYWKLQRNINDQELMQSLEAEFKRSNAPHPLKLKTELHAKRHERFHVLVKLNKDNSDIVDFNFDATKTGQNEGTVSIHKSLKNIIQVDGNIEIKKGSYRSNFLVNLPAAPRKIKTSAAVTVADGKVDLKYEVLFDADRDPSKRLLIVSDTTYNRGTGLEINSKSNVQINDQKSDLTIKARLGKTVPNVQHGVDIELKLPSGQTVTFTAGGILHKTDNLRGIVKKIALKTPNGKSFSINLDSKFNIVSRDPIAFDGVTDFVIDLDGKTVKYHSEAKRQVTGNTRNYNGKVVLEGNLIQKKIEGTTEAKVIGKDFTIKTIVKRGDKTYTFDHKGKFDFQSEPRILVVDTEASLPYEKLKHVKLTTDAKWSYAKGDHLDYSSKNTIQLNHGEVYGFDEAIKLSPGNFEYDTTVISPDKKERGFQVGLRVTPHPRKVAGFLGLKFDTNKEFKLSGSAYKDEHQFGIKTVVVTPSEKLKKFELQWDHKDLGAGKCEGDFVIGFNENRKLTIRNELEWTAARKVIDLTLKTESGKSFHLYKTVERRGDGQFYLQTKLDAGDKHFESAGEVHFTSVDDFELKGTANGPAFGVNSWQIRASKKLTGRRQRVVLDIRSNDQNELNINLDYTKKEAKNEITYQGTATYQRKANPKYSGDFKSTKLILETRKDGEEGKQYQAEVKLTSEDGSKTITANLDIKRTDQTRRIFNNVCVSDNCVDVELFVKNTGRIGHDLDAGYGAIYKHTKGGATTTRGIKSVTTWKKHDLLHEFQVIFNKEKNYISGYKFVANRKELALSAKLLDHETYLGAEFHPSNNRIELSFAPCKTHKADKKAAIIINYQKKSADEGRAYDIDVSLKHPALQRDLSVKGSLQYGGKTNLLSYKLEFDTFRARQHHIVANGQLLRQPISGGHNYTFTRSVKSTDQAIDIESTSHIAIGYYDLGFGYTVDYLNHQKKRQHFSYDASIGVGFAGFSLTAPSGDTWEVRHRWNKETSNDERSIQLHSWYSVPGVDPYVTVYELSTAPSFSGKIYREAEPQKYLKGEIGVIEDGGFGVSFYHQEGGKKSSLAELVIRIKNFLFDVNADWNKENFQKVAKLAQEKIQKIREALKAFLKKTAQEVSEDLAQRLKQISENAPDLSPIAESFRQQFREIRESIKNSEAFNDLKQFVEKVKKLVGVDLKHFIELVRATNEVIVEFFEKVAEKFVERYRQIRERVKQIAKYVREHLPEWIDVAIEKLREFAHRVKEIAKVIGEKLKKFVEEFPINHPKVVEFIKSVRKALQGLEKQIVEILKNAIAKAREIRQKIREFLEKSGIKDIIDELVEELHVVAKKIVVAVDNFLHKKLNFIREHWPNVIPIDKVEEFLNIVKQYLLNKLDHVAVDDTAVIFEILRDLRSILSTIYDNVIHLDLDKGEFRIRKLPLLLPLEAFRLAKSAISRIDFYTTVQLLTPRPGSFVDIYNRIKYMTYAPALVGPFKAVASIVDSKYFITFDGKAYGFAGQCPYLLAADFVDHNFTVSIKFEAPLAGQTRKTLIVTLGKDRVDIPANYRDTKQVVVNGNAQAAPVTVNSAKVLNNGHQLIVKDRGFSVACSLHYDECIVSLDGYYLGHTAGLLGTHNYEHIDDYILPTGKFVNTPEKFISKWKLDNSCTERPQPVVPASEANAPAVCTSAFREDGLRPCFHRRNVHPFHHVCSAVVQQSTDKKKAACTVVQNYVHACNSYQFIPIRLPSTCQH